MAEDLRPRQPKIFERMEGEGMRPFQAFIVYRDLGPTRTLDQAARIFYPNRANEKEALGGRISNWSAKWHWQERARAWDDELDRQARESRFDTVKEMNRRHITGAKAIQTKALMALQKLDPEKMSPTEVIKMFAEAAKIERVATGEPDAIQQNQHVGADGGPIQLQEAKADHNQIAEILKVLADANVISIPSMPAIDVQATPQEALPAPTNP